MEDTKENTEQVKLDAEKLAAAETAKQEAAKLEAAKAEAAKIAQTKQLEAEAELNRQLKIKQENEEQDRLRGEAARLVKEEAAKLKLEQETADKEPAQVAPDKYANEDELIEKAPEFKGWFDRAREIKMTQEQVALAADQAVSLLNIVNSQKQQEVDKQSQKNIADTQNYTERLKAIEDVCGAESTAYKYASTMSQDDPAALEAIENALRTGKQKTHNPAESYVQSHSAPVQKEVSEKDIVRRQLGETVRRPGG